MSFGVSIGDIIKVAELSAKVVNACRHGPREYREICAEAKALQGVLSTIRRDAEDEESLLNQRRGPRKEELLTTLSSCEIVLKQLEGIIEKNSSLRSEGSEKRITRVWHSYRTGSADLNTIVCRLSFFVACINAFQQSLEGSTIARIERKVDALYARMLEETVSEEKTGDSGEVASIMSMAESVRSRLDTDKEDTWQDIQSTLASYDLSIADLATYKEEIIGYLKARLDSGGARTEYAEISDMPTDTTRNYRSTASYPSPILLRAAAPAARSLRTHRPLLEAEVENLRVSLLSATRDRSGATKLTFECLHLLDRGQRDFLLCFAQSIKLQIRVGPYIAFIDGGKARQRNLVMGEGFLDPLDPSGTAFSFVSAASWTKSRPWLVDVVVKPKQSPSEAFQVCVRIPYLWIPPQNPLFMYSSDTLTLGPSNTALDLESMK